MKKRPENCKYCGSKLDKGTTRKSFCSDKCRVYWNRENKDKINLSSKIDYVQPTKESYDGSKKAFFLEDEMGQLESFAKTSWITKKNLAALVETDANEIASQIKILENEKMPDYIKSDTGKIIWKKAKEKKIKELKQQLK